MTTSPVVSITDELIAELEECERDGLAAWINAADISALLAERADLKQQLAAASVDAERWRYARDLLHSLDIREFKRARDSSSTIPAEEISLKCDAAIDAARNIGSN